MKSEDDFSKKLPCDQGKYKKTWYYNINSLLYLENKELSQERFIIKLQTIVAWFQYINTAAWTIQIGII